MQETGSLEKEPAIKDNKPEAAEDSEVLLEEQQPATANNSDAAVKHKETDQEKMVLDLFDGKYIEG